MKNKKLAILTLTIVVMMSILVACNVDDAQQTNEDEPIVFSPMTMKKPVPKNLGAAAKYNYEFLGLEFSYKDKLTEEFKNNLLVMTLNSEIENIEDSPVINSAFFPIYDTSKLAKKYSEITGGDEFNTWIAQATLVGGVGVYKQDMYNKDAIAELTSCQTNIEVGKSDDDKYVYYISFNSSESNYDELLKETTVLVKEMTKMPANTYVLSAPKSTATTIGQFTAKNILGKEVTQEVFKDYDLTLVNIFTTWCGPCIAEIPHLAEIQQELADKKVNVLGIVMDINDKGYVNEDKLAKAKAIATQTKANYHFIMPDDNLKQGKLKGIAAYPETFFVDSEGNIVGQTYVGAKSKEEWLAIIEKELKALKTE